MKCGRSATDEVTTDDQATAEVTEKVAALCMQQEHLATMATSSYESALSSRLWQTGFAGCTAFVQDVLFHLALVLKYKEKRLGADVAMDHIGSHGLLVSGVHGGKISRASGSAARACLREDCCVVDRRYVVAHGG